jgi:hypothetical protein
MFEPKSVLIQGRGGALADQPVPRSEEVTLDFALRETNSVIGNDHPNSLAGFLG